MLKITKHFKVIVSVIAVVVVGIVVSVVGLLKPEPLPEGVMHVDFIDVGQGDCTLIRTADAVILVDAGEAAAGNKVVSFLKEQGVEQIDCCIATHPHSDHIGAFPKVLENFKVKKVIMPELSEINEPTTQTYENFLDACENAEVCETVTAGDKLEFGSMKIEILGPLHDYKDLNYMSLVTKITYGKTSVMLTGDAESPAEEDMLERKGVDYSADILKMGHHGSSTSTCDDWLEAVNPEFAVISSGEGNEYGHPHAETIDKLENYGINYYRTDLKGDISFESDGSEFKYIDN